MAWYRCGGGGIPSSLKTGMNSVLNKKFGTSTTYAPATWPDNVNLLGPLPEKTVSGTIASFADGADDVPIKSLVCNVDANLSGVSSVGVVHTGKNFLGGEALKNAILSAVPSATVDAENKVISFASNAAVEGDIWNIFNDDKRYTFIMTCYKSSGASTNLRVYYKDDTNAFIGGATTTKSTIVFTTASTKSVKSFRKYNSGGTTYIYYEESGVFEGVLTAEEFEAYHAETKTANLGRTIYGGSVDVVQGTGTDENGNDFTFTPTPINSFLGDNNIWADTGDISDCTYRADIALALGGG